MTRRAPATAPLSIPGERRESAPYQTHADGGDFAFAGERAEKRHQLAEVEAALAQDIDGPVEPAAIAA